MPDVAWDSSRQVPWAKLVKPFVLYFVVANAAMLAIAPKKYGAGTFIGTVLGGVFYLLIGIVAIKFGWQPLSYAQRREQAAARAQERRAASGKDPSSKAGRSRDREVRGGELKGGQVKGAPVDAADRARPAPTRRTASGVGRQRR